MLQQLAGELDAWRCQNSRIGTGNLRPGKWGIRHLRWIGKDSNRFEESCSIEEGNRPSAHYFVPAESLHRLAKHRSRSLAELTSLSVKPCLDHLILFIDGQFESELTARFTADIFREVGAVLAGSTMIGVIEMTLNVFGEIGHATQWNTCVLQTKSLYCRQSSMIGQVVG